MDRVYNFSAGPSMMPLPVLESIQKDLVNYKGMGLSVMEMSHRSKMYEDIIFASRENLKKIMGISDDYAILFLQGGATLQFSSVAMNMSLSNDNIDYVITGEFAKKAYEEAKKYSKNAKAIASSEDKKYTYIPTIDKSVLSANSKYLHITLNNTIYGTMYNALPNIGDTSLVADASSIILGKEYDINKFDLMYAGAQKNIGIAGVSVVIVKKSKLVDVESNVPSILDFKKQIKNDSMLNTPPTFAIYVLGLMLEWVISQGGVKTLESINKEKAKILYDTIDNSKIFTANASVESRSIMNVNFVAKDENITNSFIDFAKTKGIINIKGHKAVGGLRASIYNAMPIEGVKKLVNAIKDFELKNK